MEFYKPKPATEIQLQQFHSEDYVDFLRRISPDNMKQFGTAMQKYNMGEYTDCPVFDGVYEFCSTYSGKSPNLIDIQSQHFYLILCCHSFI